ncbi:TaqI-like C-terminal specificity domain-containing protein [Chryseobacterium ureilyticum]|uniref:site-specific DNA-methyltransferase (adenine-specific) n=1 Tax=Chryseobacterium ureilyticum TaxID=373668 RepID=A0A1N7K512_9FLAO|nr:TaqI-like C-terminal specificity domain-containing protein [Chryseobacterium ureilyticum]SIS56692.1 TaqI-like C-terminal specificity domain-containing protein [Chryseobacterium ureilyticum]
MSDYFRQFATLTDFSSSESWVVLSSIEKEIKKKIESVGTPLKDWDINIYRGILTGYNEAFIIDGKKKEELIAEDPKSVEIIRPILRGRDIKRYGYDFADLYLLFIPWHFPVHNDPNIKGASLDAEKVFENQYPAIFRHLLKYKHELSNRNKAETGIRYEWYALQRWGANYWEDFFRPKIIFQEMVQEPSFILDLNGDYMCLDTARIITGENLEVLISILNSKLFFYAVKSFYGGGSLGESGIRMKHTFFENFPMPSFPKEIQFELRKLVNNINDDGLNEINKIIHNFFNLTSEEIEFIESQ